MQNWDLERGSEAVAMKEYCLLPCYQGLLSLFSYIAQDHLPRWVVVVWHLPWKLFNKENTPHKKNAHGTI